MVNQIGTTKGKSQGQYCLCEDGEKDISAFAKKFANPRRQDMFQADLGRHDGGMVQWAIDDYSKSLSKGMAETTKNSVVPKRKYMHDWAMQQ